MGGAGADTLDGGAGIGDTASYAGATNDLKISLLLTGGQISGGNAAGVVLIGLENLIGGNGVDFLTGDGANNRIDGGAGRDIIEGGAGKDTLIGGTSGADRDAVFCGNATAGVTVSLAITVAQNTGGAGIDVISGFEDLNGSQFADRLTGDARGNALFGSGGMTR